mgnify:CR=1 FL=1
MAKIAVLKNLLFDPQQRQKPFIHVQRIIQITENPAYSDQAKYLADIDRLW